MTAVQQDAASTKMIRRPGKIKLTILVGPTEDRSCWSAVGGWAQKAVQLRRRNAVPRKPRPVTPPTTRNRLVLADQIPSPSLSLSVFFFLIKGSNPLGHYVPLDPGAHLRSGPFCPVLTSACPNRSFALCSARPHRFKLTPKIAITFA